ncbi:unnamed protein product [Peniophora sp. CBMAI 1063]|nr:unnamed protein product [Peniophora sp. CBMAI 1063]
MGTAACDTTNDARDVNFLWQNALVEYAQETGTDLLRHDLARLLSCETVNDILIDLDDEMSAFRAFRVDVNWAVIRKLVGRIGRCALGPGGSIAGTDAYDPGLIGKTILVAVGIILIGTKGDLGSPHRQILEDVLLKLVLPLERFRLRREVASLRSIAQERAAGVLAQALRILALVTSRHRSVQWSEMLTEDDRVHEALQQLDQSTALEQSLIDAQDYVAVQRVYEDIQTLRSETQVRLNALQDYENHLRDVLRMQVERDANEGTTISCPVPTGTGRRKKDRNAPRRGLSAYMFFSQDHREQMKRDHPEASFGELGNLLGEKWRSLNDEERNPYLRTAEQDKARYERELREYRSVNSER